MTVQTNREVVPRVLPIASTMDSRLRNFIRIIPHMFYGLKVNKDPQDFIDDFYKILHDMGLTEIKNPR